METNSMNAVFAEEAMNAGVWIPRRATQPNSHSRGNLDYFSCIPIGCTDEEACNYDPEAQFEDGSCEYVTCGGCLITLACNYDPTATFDNGTCDFLTCLVFGCTDTSACNYNADAQFDDGTCSYPNFPYDCNGECQSDTDGDGICDALEILGCTHDCLQFCCYRRRWKLPLRL